MIIFKSLFVYLINISFNNRIIESLLKKMLALLIFIIKYSSELSRIKWLYEIFENLNILLDSNVKVRDIHSPNFFIGPTYWSVLGKFASKYHGKSFLEIEKSFKFSSLRYL